MALILITGASRGIGLELACQYAESGDAVVATCRDLETAKALKHLAESHPNVELQSLDVVDSLSILSLASLLSKRSDKVDLLINNAGINVPETPDAISADSFSATLETNVVAPVAMMQAFAKVMASGGKMVNISSCLGSFGLELDLGGRCGTYSASKAALNMMVRHMAPWLKAQGIATVAVHPGWVKTDMGGQDAPLSLEAAVSALRNQFAQITLEDAGSFIDYQGETLPW